MINKIKIFISSYFFVSVVYLEFKFTGLKHKFINNYNNYNKN
jgi:hypothetical protein